MTPARRLEGPGAEERLRTLRRRFARTHRAAARAGRFSWRLALMCLATFAGVVAGGWMLVR
ncbi:hypothetical protein [Phenylobacterium sp.]|uniref:hypothetical protein n=1 Tax=Phenylobacterium sp. TaxID=1871053 RepID=UPI00391CF3EC